MSPTWRRILLLAALTGVVVWSLRLAQTPPDAGDAGDTVAAVHRRPARPPVAPPHQALVLAASTPVSRLGRTMQRNLFPRQAWLANRAPKAPVAAKAPEAPPLPFTYVGRWKSAGQTTYYLAAGHQVYSAQIGQVLASDWLLSASRGQTLDFVYGPLQQTRSLRMGDRLAENPPSVQPAPAGQ